MEGSVTGQNSSGGSHSALHVHAIKTPTFDDDGLAPICSDGDDLDDLDDFARISIQDNLKKAAAQDPMTHRFYGKSSGIVLLQTALDLKNEFSGRPPTNHRQPLESKAFGGFKRPEYWSVNPVSDHPFVLLVLFSPDTVVGTCAY
jgi:hypothetical protein